MTKQLNRIFSDTTQNVSSFTRKTIKAAIYFSTLFLLLSLLAAEESHAEPPPHDPWYFAKSTEYKFMVPDKFQHFYGSAMLTEIIGPMPALAFGVLKEVHDDVDGLVGFSSKDIAANILGIMSAKFAQTENVTLWLDWDPAGETLILNLGIRL